MAAFFYFFSGRRSVQPKDFVDAGLAHALEDGHRGGTCEMSPGPSGKGGAIAIPPSPRGSTPPAAAADAARWVQVPERDVWIGWLPDAPPTPRDLARAEQVPGHEVKLADGARWLVPVARRISGATGLPRALRWDGRGWTTGDVVAQHAQLWAIASRVWDAMLGGVQGGVTLDVECDAAALALSTNYRLGPPEIGALGLFTTATQMEVIKALVDLPVLEAFRGEVEPPA
jgi:hypothetical protein